MTATPPASTPDLRRPALTHPERPAAATGADDPRRRTRGTRRTDDDRHRRSPSAGSRSRASARSSTAAPRPAKAVVGEQFTVGATVFREGHDAVNASVVLVAPDGSERVTAMTPVNPGLNTWSAVVEPDAEGWWTYRVEGWSDPYGTWDHDATIKVAADVDAELMLEEGARTLERALAEVERTHRRSRPSSQDAVTALRDTRRPPLARLHAGTDPSVRAELAARPLRDHVSPSAAYPLLVERERALYGAWYEIFPRSEGAVQDPETGKWTSGTLRTAAERLPAIARMGFDVVYLTPIHPIGTTGAQGTQQHPRRRPRRPGQPLRHRLPRRRPRRHPPRPRHFDDFDFFVAQAEELGPGGRDGHRAPVPPPTTPTSTTHPEWFTHRADGTIAYAENPPKKYQDIYPLNFDNDPAGSYAEMRRMIQVWIDHGVKIFRVDNPHTKPVEFWQWLIDDVGARPPRRDLAGRGVHQAGDDAHARQGRLPAVLHLLRLAQPEVGARGVRRRELAGDAAAYMRPSFWPTTHDILTPYMQFGGPAAWKLRAALAATLVPTYGIYAGYELIEHVARPGAEEQIDNEKYQYKNRHWEDYEPGGVKEGQSLAGYLTRLNEIRREHPALHWLRNITFHHVDDENIMAFSKRRVLPDGTEDTVVVVANLDPHSTRESTVHLDMPALGLDYHDGIAAQDLITGALVALG